MALLFTLIGLIAIGFLLWRTFGPQVTERAEARHRGPVGPDDDPDFLMDLDRRTHRPGQSGPDADDT
ncbi:hypothetical protein GYA93_09785 [Gordonia desulfuricans]|uniref:Uncharacterized protein n=1 Tax=Gordonia desulfuricans TaxID=89051 RepID=A0A7K3LNQ2_9ACTN|nr:hypothetical protein [Gordonia desulfuricans]NDK89866.1 hypothetical protein [Gordonia desulfuricans]